MGKRRKGRKAKARALDTMTLADLRAEESRLWSVRALAPKGDAGATERSDAAHRIVMVRRRIRELETETETADG